MLHALIALGGPVFGKELVELSRRRRYFATRLLYGFALLFALFVTWQGTSFARRIGGQDPTLADIADLAGWLFLAVCYVQYLAVYVFVPLMLAGTICSEREEHTLELLFTTHLRDREIVLGKVGSRLAVVLLLFLSGLPVLAIIRLFGGIDGATLWRVEAATLLGMTVSGSLATYFSVVSPTPMVALVRTYWWLGLWLLLSPVLAMMLQGILSYGNSSFQDFVRLLNFITWTNPLLAFFAAFDPYGMGSRMPGTSWFFSAFWPRFLVPSLVAVFFAWRAVQRLRYAPRPLFSMRRLVANPAFDRDPLEALVRRVQPPPLPAQPALSGESPFSHEMAVAPPDTVDALESSAAQSIEIAAATIDMGTSPFAGDSADVAPLEATSPREPWFEHRGLAVRNPLWRRARLARVYDRDRYLFRIQIAGSIIVLGFLLCFFLGFLYRALVYQNFEPLPVESALLLLVPTWIVIWLLTAIVAGSSLVGDRRRGFLDQVLVTPIDAGEIVRGTWLAVVEHLKLAYALPAVVLLIYVLLFDLPLVPAILSWVLGVAFGAVIVALGTTCSLVARQTGQALVPALALPIASALGWPILTELVLSWNRDDSLTWYMLCCAAVLVVTTLSWVLLKVQPTSLRAGLAAIGLFQLLLVATTPLVLTLNEPYYARYNTSYQVFEMVMASNPVGVVIGALEELPTHRMRQGYTDEHLPAATVLLWCAPFLASAAIFVRWNLWWATHNFDRLTERTLRRPDQPSYLSAPTIVSEAS
jgi:ABC-type Na+ efflux pump permease subunit